MNASASPDRITREETIFNAAIELRGVAKRAAYLDLACEGDPALRARLEKMLAADADSFFEKPIPAPSLAEAATLAAPQSPDPEPAAPGEHIGRYKLLQKIGEGGCGVVYMAEQEEPVRRRVALKVIKLGMDTKSVIARFEAERQALALMDHPNIAKIYDAGATTGPALPSPDELSPALTPRPSPLATHYGRPYFVMELVRGIKITEYCDQHSLPTRDRLELFIKVCQAVQHAHQKGIIHRDIKPSNILVTLHDGVPVPKVIDFGIAKATTDQRLTDKTLFTALEQFIGTPAYMSPEQAEMSGLDLDTRCDIYSLGVLLYELLTGQTPFDAKELLASGIDAMRKTIREKVPLKPSTRVTRALVASEVTRRTPTDEPSASSRRRLQELVNLLRGDVDWIVMKCLEKDRARRYETANGLASDIQRHLNNEAVLARPPSAAYRFQKMVRRNKLAFAAATAVAAALVIGLGAATVMFFRERQARKGEQQQRLTAQSAQKVSETERQHSRRLLYAADMNLAQQTLKLNNLGRARRLLDRHRPQPGEEDLRGWEWRYLWQLTRSSALVTLTNRPSIGFSVSFSPDGTRLAVGWFDGHVDLWDVPGRRLIRALTDRESSQQGRVAFSPVRNLLAATSKTNVVALYDLDSGRESVLWQAPDQRAWCIKELSFSHDGSRLVFSAGSVTREFEEYVWVLNVSSAAVESRHPTFHWAGDAFCGPARLSPDNRHLFLAPSIGGGFERLDVTTGKELWRTEPEPMKGGLRALAISPDGRWLASCGAYSDPTIYVFEAETGRLLVPLNGHTGYVCKLVFTRDGRRLISAANDQCIRFWDTSPWTETQVLRGHTDEIQGVAISETAQLVASAGKDGNLMLWKDDGKSLADGYRRLPENKDNEDLPLDRSRLLLLAPGQPPELIDLKAESAARSLPELGSSTNVLGWFGSNILCHWNGTNQILVRELRGAEFILRGTVTANGLRLPPHPPGSLLQVRQATAGFAYNPTRQLMAWTEWSSSNSVYLASLNASGNRIELKSDIPGLAHFRFSEDGNYLEAWTEEQDSPLRVWNVETAQIVASINEPVHNATFAAGGQVLVVDIVKGNDHEIGFYNLAHPDRVPRRVPGRHSSWALAASPDGKLVASASDGGLVRLFDAAKGESIEPLHGHLMAVSGVAFSPDGRRLMSTYGGREAVKLWDVGTRQELLTLSGTGSDLYMARWSADGDVILVGALWHPWQTWRAPSWEEIAAAEAKEKTESKQP